MMRENLIMRRLFKLFLLPIAISCCSMSKNEPSIKFVALAIENEDFEKKTFTLGAYIDILGDYPSKTCRYSYSWVSEDGESEDLGGSVLISLSEDQGYLLYGCKKVSTDKLNEHSPVTLICEATVPYEGTYRISMPYCTKTVNEFTITESLNHQEQTTGYDKESTFVDPKFNYHYEDAFTFLNFEDLRVNEVYYDIDLSYLRFKYRNGLDEILKGDFTFAFYDRYNLFPDFPIGESMYRYIPLTFNRDGDECYFTFTPTIYYDPATHESSLIQKEGYLAYDHLMLPFKASAELKFLPCYFELKVHSHSDFTITAKFMMTYLKRYFGDCEDSEFCEEIHQDDETNIREKVIEVVI